MKLFSQVLEAFQDGCSKAYKFIEDVTTSSRLGALPDAYTAAILKRTVQPGGMYAVYRGIALDEYPEGWSKEVGAIVPPELIVPHGSQLVIHATHSQSEALSYAQGKKIALVYRMVVWSSDVIFDSNHVDQILSSCPLPPETLEYFSRSQEILIRRDAKVSAFITWLE